MDGMSTHTASTVDSILQQERIETLRRAVHDLRAALADVDAAVADQHWNAGIVGLRDVALSVGGAMAWGLGTFTGNWWVEDAYQIFTAYHGVLTGSSAGENGALEMAGAGGAKYELAVEGHARHSGSAPARPGARGTGRGRVAYDTVVDVARLGAAIRERNQDAMVAICAAIGKDVAGLVRREAAARVLGGVEKAGDVYVAVKAVGADPDSVRLDMMAGATRWMIHEKIRLFSERLYLGETRRGNACVLPF